MGMIVKKLTSKTTGFSDKEIKKAIKKLKKAGIPKELWYVDTLSGPSDEKFVTMLAPELFTTTRYML